MPLLESLAIRGLLSFGWQPTELKLGAMNLIIGPNGSGKSNLFDILHLLRALPHNLQDALRERGGSASWLHKGTGGSGLAMVDAVLNWGDDDFAPVFYRSELRMVGDALTIQAEQLRTRDPVEELDNTPLLLAIRAGAESAAKFARQSNENQTAGANTAQERPQHMASQFYWERTRSAASASILNQWRHQSIVGKVARDLLRTRIYTPFPFGPSAPVRRPQSADQPNDFLDPTGQNLGLVLSRIKQTPETWKSLMDRFRSVYEAARDIDIFSEGGTVQIILDEGYRTPATRLSDGTLRWLFLTTLLLDPQPPPVIALEEPELGLHPDLLPRLADLLKDASLRTQLIVTTHSPELVSAFSDAPEDVVVCERYQGCTEFRRLAAEPLKHWLESYSLGEAWRAGEIGGNRFG